jgi:hypothetical protein
MNAGFGTHGFGTAFWGWLWLSLKHRHLYQWRTVRNPYTYDWYVVEP